MTKLNGKEKPGMSNNRRKTTYSGNARFIELGSPGAPFRSLVNVDHLTNCRFEQRIEEQGGSPAQFNEEGEMIAPPQHGIPTLLGWSVVLVFGGDAQALNFDNEAQAVACYNTILDMILGTGIPMARVEKLTPTPEKPVIQGLDGAPIANDGIAPLTDEEMDQLENPEIDVDAIAKAVDEGLGADVSDDDSTK